MPARNVQGHEVWLGDTWFPIKGQVRVANITVPPNPVVFGDVDKATGTQVMQQFAQSSYLGGGQIYKGDILVDGQRFYTSQCETRFKNMLCLPPLVNSLTNPGSSSLILTQKFGDYQFFFFADQTTYYWTGSGSTLTSVGQALAPSPYLVETPAAITTGTGVSSLALARPKVYANNLLIAEIAVAGGTGTTITPPSGWTLVLRTNSGTDIGIATYRKLATSSEPSTYTWTFSGAVDCSGQISTFGGVNATTQVEASGGQANAASVNLVAPSITTLSNAVTLYYAGATLAVGLDAWTAGWTAIGSASTHTVNSITQIKEQATAGATGTVTATCAAAGINVAQLLSIKSSSPSPTDTAIYNAKMYIATDSPTVYVASLPGTDPTLWTTTTCTIAAHYLFSFNTKLYAMSATGEFASFNGVAWTTLSPLNQGPVPTDLLVYRNASGDPTMYAATDSGFFALATTTTAGIWVETEIKWPQDDNAGKNSVVGTDGRLYAHYGGLGVIAATIGDPTTITPVGMDRDDGVPSEQSHTVYALASDIGWILSLGANSSTGYATLRAYHTGPGWHYLYEVDGGSTYGYPASVLALTKVNGTRRIVFSMGTTIKYIDLPDGIYNPRVNTSMTFSAATCEHITPWFDYGSQVKDKLHGHLIVSALIHGNASGSDNSVAVYIGTDLDDDTWTLLGTITSNTTGTYTQTFMPNTPQGQNAKFFRYKFALTKGSVSLSPIVTYWVADYMPLLPATYGYVFNVPTSQGYENLSATALIDALKRLSDPAQTPDLIEFAWRDDYGKVQTYYAKISRLTGVEEAGTDNTGEGEYLVSVVVPYTEDAI